MVYVSTAYTNVDKLEAREVIYSRDYQPDEIINMVNTLSDEALEKVLRHTFFLSLCSQKAYFTN